MHTHLTSALNPLFAGSLLRVPPKWGGMRDKPKNVCVRGERLAYKLSGQCKRILASERNMIKRAPSWIRTRKRFGKRRKSIQGSATFVNTRKTPALQAIIA